MHELKHFRMDHCHFFVPCQPVFHVLGQHRISKTNLFEAEDAVDCKVSESAALATS